MGRPLASTVILAPLVLLGACLEMAPRSSVPFQATAERQTRYAAEIALAVKEDRGGETSEAAANGRVVLPQLPEIWAPPVADHTPRSFPREIDLAGLEPEAGRGPAGRGCSLMSTSVSGDASLTDCRPIWPGEAPVLPLPDRRAIPPTPAPSALDPGVAAAGAEARPPG